MATDGASDDQRGRVLLAYLTRLRQRRLERIRDLAIGKLPNAFSWRVVINETVNRLRSEWRDIQDRLDRYLQVYGEIETAVHRLMKERGISMIAARAEVMASSELDQALRRTLDDRFDVSNHVNWLAVEAFSLAGRALNASSPADMEWLDRLAFRHGEALSDSIEAQRIKEDIGQQIKEDIGQQIKEDIGQQIKEDIRQRSTKGGQAKRGKLAPHNELIRRVLLYDPDIADRGEIWLVDSLPRPRSLPYVLELLEVPERFADLVNTLPPVRISRVRVDREAQTVDFTYADHRERQITFRTLQNLIARFCRGT
jgi:hypothetical protein